MFWKELFHAATQMDDQILANVHLHCLQLLGGEIASYTRQATGIDSCGKRTGDPRVR